MNASQNDFLAALGPLASLYSAPDVLEIMVDAPDRIWVEREGVLVDSGIKLGSVGEIHALITGLLALSGESLKAGQTILQLQFPESQARGMAVLPPTAIQGPCLVIRKLMNSGWLTWEKLIEFNSVTRESMEFLQKAVRVPVNILVAGGTASGKTTVANRIAELIPPEARLVIVEDTHELQIRHPRAVYLEAAGMPDVNIDNLILTGSKMCPTWLIIGELSGVEALRAVEVLGRGHSGMTTIHSNSLEDALARLEAMCLMASMGLGLVEIRNMIAAAIQLVCYQKLLPSGRRKIVEIAEIKGLENGKYIIERLFRYLPEVDRLEATGIKPSWEE